MKRLRLYILSILLILTVSAQSEEQVRVGILPVTVAGDYQPLDSEQATSLLFQGLQANNVKAELVLLERQDGVQTLPQALELAKSENLEMIVWGRMWFRKDSYTTRSPSPYYRGRVSVQVATEAALKVAWVPQARLVLSQPTIVVSSQKTLSWVSYDTRHFSEEQSMAANSVREVADSLVHVVRKRHQAGWFQQP